MDQRDDRGARTEAFRRFLHDFCEHGATSAPEEDEAAAPVSQRPSAPTRCTDAELEGDVTEWALQVLSLKHCPRPLAFALAHQTFKELERQDLKRFLLQDDASEKGGEPGFDSRRLLQAIQSKVSDVCRAWLVKGDSEFLLSDEPFPEVSVSAIKNARRSMEDRHVTIPDLNVFLDLENEAPRAFYAVFDGHAGHHAAVYAASHLHLNIIRNASFATDVETAIRDGFQKTDRDFLAKCARENWKSGSTVVCALVERTRIAVAWLGDSQAVLARHNLPPLNLVKPHKPEREDEKKRIEDLGGSVIHFGTWRVNGTLAVSRAIGDADYKPFVISEPDVVCLPRQGSEEFLILACDGLWDVMTAEDATNGIYSHLMSNPVDVEGITQKLIHTAVQRGSGDNITVIVVFLRSPEEIVKSWTCSFQSSLSESPPVVVAESPVHPPNGDVCTNACSDNKSDASSAIFCSVGKVAEPRTPFPTSAPSPRPSRKDSETDSIVHPTDGKDAISTEGGNLWPPADARAQEKRGASDARERFPVEEEGIENVVVDLLQNKDAPRVQEYFLASHVEFSKFELETNEFCEVGSSFVESPSLSSFDSKASQLFPCALQDETAVCEPSETGGAVLENVSDVLFQPEMQNFDNVPSILTFVTLPQSSSIMEQLMAAQEIDPSEPMSLEPITVEKIPESVPIAEDVVDDESEDGDDWRYFQADAIRRQDQTLDSSDLSKGEETQTLEMNAPTKSKQEPGSPSDDVQVGLAKSPDCCVALDSAPPDDNRETVPAASTPTHSEASAKPLEQVRANKTASTRAKAVDVTKTSKQKEQLKSTLKKTTTRTLPAKASAKATQIAVVKDNTIKLKPDPKTSAGKAPAINSAGKMSTMRPAAAAAAPQARSKQDATKDGLKSTASQVPRLNGKLPNQVVQVKSGAPTGTLSKRPSAAATATRTKASAASATEATLSKKLLKTPSTATNANGKETKPLNATKSNATLVRGASKSAKPLPREGSAAAHPSSKLTKETVNKQISSSVRSTTLLKKTDVNKSHPAAAVSENKATVAAARKPANSSTLPSSVTKERHKTASKVSTNPKNLAKQAAMLPKASLATLRKGSAKTDLTNAKPPQPVAKALEAIEAEPFEALISSPKEKLIASACNNEKGAFEQSSKEVDNADKLCAPSSESVCDNGHFKANGTADKQSSALYGTSDDDISAVHPIAQ